MAKPDPRIPIVAMAAFPPNPVDGQEFTDSTGQKWVYDASLPGWRRVTTPPSGEAARFEYPVSPAATVWNVPHAFGVKYVAPQVIDSAGNTVISDIDWAASTAMAVKLVFANPVAGTAIIRR